MIIYWQILKCYNKKLIKIFVCNMINFKNISRQIAQLNNVKV